MVLGTRSQDDEHDGSRPSGVGPEVPLEPPACGYKFFILTSGTGLDGGQGERHRGTYTRPGGEDRQGGIRWKLDKAGSRS